MTADEIPAEWLRVVHDAYRAAFGQAELNLVGPGLPVVIQAVRPLIEAQAAARVDPLIDQIRAMLGRPETQWAARCDIGTGEGMRPCDDEQDAREFIACLPREAREHWRVVSREVWRHEGPWIEVPDGNG